MLDTMAQILRPIRGSRALISIERQPDRSVANGMGEYLNAVFVEFGDELLVLVGVPQ